MMKAGLMTMGLLCLGAITLLLSNCLSVTSNQAGSSDLPEDLGGQAIDRREQLGRVHLRSVEYGSLTKPPILFIHGTPGQWQFFQSYINHPQLQENARLIAIDRPGWGESKIQGISEATLREQSAFLGDWLCELAASSPKKKLVIVGHSYGATLTPRLAMDHPDCVSAMLLLAGASNPDLAEPRWYNHLTNIAPFSWLAGSLNVGLRRSNAEMMHVQEELELMRPMWGNLQLPATVIQGGNDILVHPDNADFVEEQLKHIPARVIRLADEGHMVVHSHREMVVSEILALLD